VSLGYANIVIYGLVHIYETYNFSFRLSFPRVAYKGYYKILNKYAAGLGFSVSNLGHVSFSYHLYIYGYRYEVFNKITMYQLMIQTLCHNTYCRRVQLLLLGGLPLLMSACGGGTGTEGPDPGIVDYPIAYVKRPHPVDNQGDPAQEDIRDPLLFSGGGDLYLRSRSSTNADEQNITGSITGGTGDVRDIDVSFDGTKIIFSLRLADPDPNDDIIPPWNIWEYNLETAQLRSMMSAVNAGKGDDISPRYLPDGRIVFASTRQKETKSILLQENLGKPQFSALDENENTKAFALHIMDEDGNNIEQLSFNQSHDLDPVVLNNGEIMFSRWDNMNRVANAFSLYKMSPDGANLQIIYGGHSHASGTAGNLVPVQFVRPREMMDGRVMAILKPFTGTFGGGDIVIIDVPGNIDNAQQSATINNISTDLAPSPGGRYHDAYPLWDGTSRMLVSKSFCQLDVNGVLQPCIEPFVSDPNAQEAPPLYSIWIYDRSENTEKPIVLAEPGRVITDIVAAQPRPRPATLPAATLNPTWETEGVGALHIRSVYDLDGNFNNLGAAATDISTLASSLTPADQRPARFLRLIKSVGLPDPNDPDLVDPPDLANTAFGPQRRLGMREILGYAPIEPDGSVMVKVPANVPFSIEVLDSAGRRLGGRHDNWLQVRAGETLECNGCHAHPATGTPLPHGRSDLAPTAVNQGAGVGMPPSLPWPLNIGLDTDPNIFAENGDTMALARYKSCVLNPGSCSVNASSIDPTIDVLYEDFWTDPNNMALTLNPDISYRYVDLTHLDPLTEAPLNFNGCQNSWQKNCRIVINYLQHIEPIWTAPRTDAMMNDVTCTNCHSTRDAANNLQIPAGQLNLTNITTDYPASFIPNADQVDTYRELLFASIELDLDMAGTALLDIGTHNPPMTAAGALASTAFFSRFDAGSSHDGYLTGAERRLIAEWLDIGAQYYNNPFDPLAPQN
jgi:hypothetical protein